MNTATTAPTPIDLRSDTVTQPTPAMRAAMLSAPLGDDVFGDDPSVIALQSHIAALTGKEAALFLPSGTQSNLCALMAHCGRGDEYLVGQLAHCYRYEGGGAAVLGSIQPQPLAQNGAGQMAFEDIAGAIKPDDPHFARTRLLCLENTWNGFPMPMEYLHQACTLAKKHGLATHLDGARLCNAAVAMATAGADAPGSNHSAAAAGAIENLRAISGLFDSVSVCFSKGLAAPVGSALCASQALIDRAGRIRKMLGGGMRQAGVLAAAAHYALENHIARLAEDHARAQQLAQGLARISAIRVQSAQTNIVFAATNTGQDAALLAYLRSHGVLATGLIGMRFVTHLGISDDDIARTLALVAAFFKK